jgi:hypothetical protein
MLSPPYVIDIEYPPIVTMPVPIGKYEKYIPLYPYQYTADICYTVSWHLAQSPGVPAFAIVEDKEKIVEASQ